MAQGTVIKEVQADHQVKNHNQYLNSFNLTSLWIKWFLWIARSWYAETIIGIMWNKTIAKRKKIFFDNFLWEREDILKLFFSKFDIDVFPLVGFSKYKTNIIINNKWSKYV